MPDEAGQPGVQPLAEFTGPLLVLARPQQRDHGPAHRAGERVAAERGPVLTRAQQPEYLPGRGDRGDRYHASAEGLAQHVHVRPHAFGVAGERRAGTPQAGLHLVGDEQHVALVAQLADTGQVAGRRYEYPGLALDRLDHDRDRRLVHGGGDRVQVAVRHDPEPGRVGPVVAVRVGVGREADDRGRTAVEVVLGHHDRGGVLRDALDLVPPLARHLDGRLDRLGAGVHRQHEVGAAQVGEFVAERPELVVQERPAGERDPVELVAGGRDQGRVPVAEVECGVPGQAVQVPPAVDVGDPGALGVGDDDRQRMVVVRREAFGLLDGATRQVVEHGGHRRTSNVQHFGPPPALRSSDRWTGIGSYPREANWSASPRASAGSTTRRPSLTALSPSTAASAGLATTASGNSRRSTARLPGENASGR